MPNLVTATKLIGSVTVQPATVKPGEPVLVQVCDSNGRPYADNSGVTITINGVEATSRYYQFAAPGTINLTVRAVHGATSETSTATIQVTGEALAFRRTLSTPALTAMPILQLKQDLASPYAATFTLGTPTNMLPLMAQKFPATLATSPATNTPAAGKISPAVDLARLSGTVNATPAAGNATPSVDLQTEVVKTLAAVPAAQITQAPISSLTSKAGVKVISSASFAPIGAGSLQTKPVATSYKWDFGDGTVLTTQSPTATHDFFPAIQAGKVAHSFNVTCTIVHDNITVKRTLVLNSAYGMCRRLGTIVPHITGDVYAKEQNIAFSGSMIVHNLEPQAVTLSKMACIPLNSDTSADLPAPKFTLMSTPVTIKANSASGVGVYIPFSQLGNLGPNVPGFTVFYSGVAADGKTPVRFSHTFRISLNDSGRVQIPMVSKVIDSAVALEAVKAVATDPKTGVSKTGDQVMDPATNTVAMALSANQHAPNTLAQVRTSVQAGLTSVAAKQGVTNSQGLPIRSPNPPPAPGPVQQGQICDPDNISDAEAATAKTQQLVCQLTNVTETVLMPASFQNAFKGDVILSPGGDGADQMIASLLRALSPPQYHSHSGIMTQNFVEITHCTAAAQRMADNTTGIGGAGGIQQDVLQYGWPGSITQTIDAATNGENWIDPNGKTYNIGGFTPEALGIISNGEFMLVPPLVVKPLPEDEETVRPGLRKAADTARSKGGRVDSNGNVTQKGGCYYCFYGYTKPEISEGFTDGAPADAGWAQGMVPAVCSSFVWLSMKDNSLNLVTNKQYETPADLSSSAVAQGAEVGAGTLDGLFYYSQAERQQAAQVLNQIFQTQVLQKEGFFQYIPLLGSDIASNIADQIMNMFAFNSPNMYGSSAWQNAGDANAVSPDNITWWNQPAFGYAEPLQYLQQHTEQYTVSRWTKVITMGTISGKVTINGSPAKGAYVYVYDGMSATCDANGQYKMDSVPIGKYNIKAQTVVNGIEYSASQSIDLTAGNPNLTVNIPLQTLPVDYRRLDLLYQWSSDHGDDNPFNTHGVKSAGPDQQSVPLGPGKVTNSCTASFDYNGGGYFRIEYQMSAVLAQDLSIQVTIVGRMYDDGSNSEQGERTINFNVPPGGQYVWELDLECDGFGYHNGPSKFTGTATNNQETS